MKNVVGTFINITNKMVYLSHDDVGQGWDKHGTKRQLEIGKTCLNGLVVIFTVDMSKGPVPGHVF